MKAYKNLCIAVMAVFLLLTAALNIFLVGSKDNSEGIYRVEARRLAGEIAQTGSYGIEKYQIGRASCRERVLVDV